jgi:hypothetical protein
MVLQQRAVLPSRVHIWFKFQVGPVTSLQTRWYVGRLKRKLAGFWWNIHFLEDDDNKNCELNPATRWSPNNRDGAWEDSGLKVANGLIVTSFLDEGLDDGRAGT